jgi:transposase-like protein
MNLMQASKLTEAEARAHFESIRWPNGPVCPRCSGTNVARLGCKAGELGQFKCRPCCSKFTVKVGTIFESSHLPMRTWLMAFAILVNAKKSVSAHQLKRSLGIGCYQTAWHLAHRIRHVLRSESLARLLTGSVESDEMYVGGRARGRSRYIDGRQVGPPRTIKTPILTLVERGGELRAMALDYVTAKNLRDALKANVDENARLLTDEANVYIRIGREFKGGHETVKHSAHEYARGDAHVNNAESFHSLVRRGIWGSFHHVSRRHMHRYVTEFEWRWNHRNQTDPERTLDALKQADGRRLAYEATQQAAT